MSNIQKMWLASLRAHWLYLLIVLLFFGFGCTLGILAVDYLDNDQVNKLGSYLDTFIEQAATINIDSQRAVKSSIMNNLIVVLAVYLMGLTVLGIPMVLALLFFRGFVLGFAVGFLTKQKAWQGTLLAVVSILPQNLFYIPALLMAAVASLSFSVLLVKRYFNTQLAVWPSFLGYNLLMLIAAAAAVGAGFVEAYFTPWLIKTSAAVLTG
ncbi:stage II sporulation protein M [Desulfohalotomaculum tongense]|uniref:stage II sporulation protein M n=1 Tax=Desulforadius tongensis TaxID=1216062 RepID=UPI00195EFED3|nr:stage II sporulation protein M [Desulforadius tongensis]MBM7854701.1 stage II sporulation protein M [Desulforadius tongensis]